MRTNESLTSTLINDLNYRKFNCSRHVEIKYLVFCQPFPFGCCPLVINVDRTWLMASSRRITHNSKQTALNDSRLEATILGMLYDTFRLLMFFLIGVVNSSGGQRQARVMIRCHCDGRMRFFPPCCSRLVMDKPCPFVFKAHANS